MKAHLEQVDALLAATVEDDGVSGQLPGARRVVRDMRIRLLLASLAAASAIALAVAGATEAQKPPKAGVDDAEGLGRQVTFSSP